MEIVLLLLWVAIPFLLVGWLALHRRSLRRQRHREPRQAPMQRYTEAVKTADGLTFSRGLDVNEELLETAGTGPGGGLRETETRWG